MKKTRHIRVITAMVVALLLVVGMAEASFALAASEQEGAPVIEENDAQTPSAPDAGSEADASEADSSDADSPDPPFSDLAPKIEGPKEVMRGEELEITISTVADGTDSPMATEGLEFISADSELCHESYVVLVPPVIGGSTLNRVVYRFRVADNAGDRVAIRLTDLHVAVDNPPDNTASIPALTWEIPVVEKVSDAARSLRSRGHYFDFAGDAGFDFAVASDGEPVVKGFAAARSAKTAAAYAQKLIPPAGGSFVFRGADGGVLSPEDTVYTGCFIDALDKEGRVLETASLVVRGDLLGNGKAGIQQLACLASSIVGDNELTPLQMMAADHNESNRIDIADIRAESNLLLA